MGRKSIKERIHVYVKLIHLRYTVETNKTLWRKYTSIKIKKKIQSCSWKVKKIFLIESLGNILRIKKKKIKRKSFSGLFLRTREAVKDCKVIPTKQPVDKCGVATVSQPCVCSRLRVPTWLTENVFFSCKIIFYSFTFERTACCFLTFEWQEKELTSDKLFFF